MCGANVFGQVMQLVFISPRPDLGQNSCPSEAVTTRIVRQGGQRAGKLRCTQCEKLECRVVPWGVLHCISRRVDRRAVDILSLFTTTCGVCTPTCDGTTHNLSLGVFKHTLVGRRASSLWLLVLRVCLSPLEAVFELKCFCWRTPWAVDRSGRGISWRTQRACLKQALDHSRWSIYGRTGRCPQ